MEDKKILFGMALLLAQMLLLAVTLGFNTACDRQLASDGISIADMLKKSSMDDGQPRKTAVASLRAGL